MKYSGLSVEKLRFRWYIMQIKNRTNFGVKYAV